MNNLKIVEGIAGYYFYHLSNDKPHKSLCGAQTMSTGLPLRTWRYKSAHLNERYFKICDKLARNDVLPELKD